MTKREFVTELARRTDVTYAQAYKMFGQVADLIREDVALGEEIRVDGLGTFKTVMKPTRVGRNPHTGEAIVVPEHKAIRFNPAAAFKKAIHNGR